MFKCDERFGDGLPTFCLIIKKKKKPMGATKSWLSKFLDYVRFSWNQNTTYMAQHSFVVLETPQGFMIKGNKASK